jgi:hypothetical protein
MAKAQLALFSSELAILQVRSVIRTALCRFDSLELECCLRGLHNNPEHQLGAFSWIGRKLVSRLRLSLIERRKKLAYQVLATLL